MKPEEEEKMDNLNRISDLVYEALESNERTRNSDTYLYYTVCNAVLRAKGYDISKITLADALLRREELGLPLSESVRRSRQKIQHDNPELAASKSVADMRAERENDYREFARS